MIRSGHRCVRACVCACVRACVCVCACVCAHACDAVRAGVCMCARVSLHSTLHILSSPCSFARSNSCALVFCPQPLSRTLLDWYSPADSPMFTKNVYTISAKIFIEATELGDILVTSGAPYAQGMEVPFEDNFTLANCGQATTLTYYMTLLDEVRTGPRLSASTVGYLSFGPIDKIFMFSVTLACARRTGAAACVERRALLAVRGRRASRSGTRAASQAFECMHSTLSHRSTT